jgi:hypothetical protein
VEPGAPRHRRAHHRQRARAVIHSSGTTGDEGIGWSTHNGAEVAPGEPAAERDAYGQTVLAQRLRDALARLNPALPADALEDAFRMLTRPEGAELIARNRTVHRQLVDGVTVEYRTAEGAIRGAQARVIDFDAPANNDFLAVNQFTVAENKHTRRPDVVLFVNGLPLVVLELKNAADETATVWTTFQQLQTYKAEVPVIFSTNELLVVSDGVEARLGTLTAGREWFKPWRTIAGERLADPHLPELQVVIEGVFAPRRFLNLVRDFIVFEDDGTARLAKKMAGYHQFHAVQVAVDETLRAAELRRATEVVIDEAGRYEARRPPGGKPGDRRIGVVWHTQGSGKSLTMAFYAGRIIREPAMENPTVVVLTDRNDLDDQLFGTFSRCKELLRQPPVQAESRAHLRELLSVAAGGVVFTTIHKFFPEDLRSASVRRDRSPSGRFVVPSPTHPEQGDRHPTLSPRRNIVVIADEAHRSQYDFIDGFARHMRDALPHASFIGFTGTPIELQDANTRAVFGDYISVYDIQRAVQDGATVPIYYESRLAKLALDEAERPKIDPDFEEATEGEEVERKEKLKTKWAQLEAVVGAEKRLKIVGDIVDHFEKRLGALAVQAVQAKRAPGDARPEEELDHAVRQIISRAVAPEGVVDIFAAAGLAKPDISSARLSPEACPWYGPRAREPMPKKKKPPQPPRASKPIGRARRIPPIKPGRYADGMPLNEVQYLECKVILRPNHFTSRKSFFDFAKVMRRPAEDAGVGFSVDAFADVPLQIREVLFLDTADFRLYNNAFILRRRIPYEDGFPVGDPEIVFKFRHPDIQQAAETDVRPNIRGDFRVKFKAEVLPLKDRLGGMRTLYSHNVEFGLSALEEGEHTSLETIVHMLPALSALKRRPGEQVDLVGGTIVEEVLQDIGTLDFGAGVHVVPNVALWRSRGEHRPLIGEFAYQLKFKRREDLNDQVLRRAEAFFLKLQDAAKEWIALGATKTGVVYRLKGNPPHAHE